MPPSSLARQELKLVPPVQLSKPVQQKQPFKEAFQKFSSTESPGPISLSSLSRTKPSIEKNPVGVNKQKIPTPKNVSDLKNALASIIGEEKKTENKKEIKETKEFSKEVPKEILENILKM